MAISLSAYLDESNGDSAANNNFDENSSLVVSSGSSLNSYGKSRKEEFADNNKVDSKQGNSASVDFVTSSFCHLKSDNFLCMSDFPFVEERAKQPPRPVIWRESLNDSSDLRAEESKQQQPYYQRRWDAAFGNTPVMTKHKDNLGTATSIDRAKERHSIATYSNASSITTISTITRETPNGGHVFDNLSLLDEVSLD